MLEDASEVPVLAQFIVSFVVALQIFAYHLIDCQYQTVRHHHVHL